MKKWIVTAGAVGLTASVAVLVARFSKHPEPSSAGRKAEGAAQTAAPSRRPAADPAVRSAAGKGIDALLAEGTREAWKQIFALYPQAGHETKRKVFQHISKVRDLDQTLQYVLETVGNDPTPVHADPMVGEAAELLQTRWRTPEDLEKGRQTMLIQKTEKRQWLVASAMVAAVKDVTDVSPLYAQKTRLMAKLVDLHARTSDEYIRSAIVDELNALGGSDAATILAKGGKGVSDDELAGVTTKRDARNDVLKGVEAK